MMDIQRATHEYEAWMRRCTKVVESELTGKHEQMRSDPFLFFRGTYYRWTQLWPEICNDLHKAPRVLGVGDLHVGSFGTWRDREGRLCWGVDDFDDAYPLPYSNDLVRLAASIRMVIGEPDGDRWIVNSLDSFHCEIGGCEGDFDSDPAGASNYSQFATKLGLAAELGSGFEARRRLRVRPHAEAAEEGVLVVTKSCPGRQLL